jgi:transcriptional regulator with PAS, ATPase and Fis domain
VTQALRFWDPARRDPAPIIGRSPAMRQAVALLERFAPTRLPILLVGARGTGKELFAQHAHWRSGRVGELVDVDCAALPPNMIEALLFGFRKGAFTGADEPHMGFVEQADRGTLFLDELLALGDDGQRKLLRVLETGEVRRLREQGKRSVDLRVVAAAQDEATELTGRSRLREDLSDRLRGIVIELPPLVERLEDVGPLATYFAASHGRHLEATCVPVLEEYVWPGNIRELRLVIDRAGYLVDGGIITATVLREAIALGAPPLSRVLHPGDRPQGTPSARDRMFEVCAANAWHYDQIAAALNISKSALYRRLTRFGISLRANRLSQ